MSDVEDIFADIMASQPSKADIVEANDRTIPGGTYRLEVVKKEMESASDRSPWPGRPMVRVSADAFYKNGDGEYHRRGRIYFDLSPKAERALRNNKQDNQTRLWLNVLSIVGQNATNQDVFDYLGQFPLTATISRTFKTLDGTWVTPKTDEDVAKLLSEGAEPRNFVQTIRAFRG